VHMQILTRLAAKDGMLELSAQASFEAFARSGAGGGELPGAIGLTARHVELLWGVYCGAAGESAAQHAVLEVLQMLAPRLTPPQHEQLYALYSQTPRAAYDEELVNTVAILTRFAVMLMGNRSRSGSGGAGAASAGLLRQLDNDDGGDKADEESRLRGAPAAAALLGPAAELGTAAADDDAADADADDPRRWFGMRLLWELSLVDEGDSPSSGVGAAVVEAAQRLLLELL